MGEQDVLNRDWIFDQQRIIHGDCIEIMQGMPEDSVDAIICDPPYLLAFMNKNWDSVDNANEMQSWHESWAREAFRVIKPGGHLLAFGGSRTYHRLASGIENAGFEIRDQIMWIYGSGFPKSMDVSKAIDRAAGVDREDLGPHPNVLSGRISQNMRGGNYMSQQIVDDRNSILRLTKPTTEDAKKWSGWGTALKPAVEPIVVARKPLIGTVVENVLKHGTGAINIDDCRIEHKTVDGGNLALNPHLRSHINGGNGGNVITHEDERRIGIPNQTGRWPANVIHDGSDEVLSLFPEAPGQHGPMGPQYGPKLSINTYGDYGPRSVMEPRGDEGSAARFFYTAKASQSDRGTRELAELPLFGEPASKEANNHPTVKPTALMEYLIKLVTPKSGLILDPFLGSGTTLVAAKKLGVRAIGIEREAAYIEIAIRRLRDSQ